MNRIFSLLCFLLLTATALKAQEANFGLKAGINFSNIYGSDTDGQLKSGLVAGGFVRLPVSEIFAVQPELLYSQQGTRGSEGTTTLKVKNDYLNIPIMAKLYVAPRFNLQLGPQIGLLLNAKFKGEVGGTKTSVDAKDLYKKSDFGINTGLEYESDRGLSLGFRYNVGLTNVMDEDVIGTAVNSKNRAIQLSIGYFFQ